VAGLGTVVVGEGGGVVVVGAGAAVVEVVVTRVIVRLTAVVLVGVPGAEPTVEVVVGDAGAGAPVVGDVVDVGVVPDVVTGRGR
jgi:hypothetical protein